MNKERKEIKNEYIIRSDILHQVTWGERDKRVNACVSESDVTSHEVACVSLILSLSLRIHYYITDL